MQKFHLNRPNCPFGDNGNRCPAVEAPQGPGLEQVERLTFLLELLELLQRRHVFNLLSDPFHLGFCHDCEVGGAGKRACAHHALQEHRSAWPCGPGEEPLVT